MRRLRRSGLKLYAIAAVAGLSPDTLARIRRGEREMAPDELAALEDLAARLKDGAS